MSLTLLRAGRYRCVYCGVQADSVDHVPPVLLKREVDKADRFCVPACQECNSTLGSKRLFTLLDRQVYIQLQYRRKYKTLLTMRDWTSAELSELGYTLRTYVELQLEKKAWVLSRLSYSCGALDPIRLPYYETTRSSKDLSLRHGAARGLPEVILEDPAVELENLIKTDPWVNGTPGYA